MNDIYKTWDFEKFITFIMYHVAMVDFNLAPEEKSLLLKRVSVEEFNDIRLFHKKNSDYENIQTILYFKDKFCQTTEAVDKVYDAMNAVIFADGEFNMYERNIKRAFQMLLA